MPPIARITCHAVSRIFATQALALALVFVAAAPALADSASLDFVDAAGRSDPVVDIGRTARITGSSAVPRSIFVKYRRAGGAPCAPAADTDSGDIFRWYGGTDVNGAFDVSYNTTWDESGTWLFCIWLANSANSSATPIAQTITFRNPTGAISATTSPATPVAGDPTTITVTGASEAPKEVFATVRAAGGAPCAPSASIDSGRYVMSDRDVDGAFSTTQVITAGKAGTYLLCLWLADSSEDPAPIAGPQAVTFTVIPPCKVPAVKRRMTLAKAQARLAKKHCSAGAVKYRYSSSRKAGRVIRFKPRSGKRLPPGSAVGIVVSKGRP